MNPWYVSYNLLVMPALYLVFRGGYYFNEKIRKGIDGRRTLFEAITAKCSSWNQVQGLGASKPKIFWFHSSSLGELEQGKPLIAALKKRYGERIKIAVSFFSPSGYEHARNYPLADLVFYLPFDSPFQARKLIRLLQPDVWILLKYDAWPNHVWAAAAAKIPIFLVSASLPRNSGRLYPLVKSLHREVYRHFKMIFAISQEDAQRLEQISSASTRILTVGDTRYDQVYLRSQSIEDQRDLIQKFSLPGRKLVAGSTWEEDERPLIKAFKILSGRYPDLRLVLVPHEPSPPRLEVIARELKKQDLRWIYASQIGRVQGADLEVCPVLVVDQVGILASLYGVADLTFVGGGFGTSIHNVMEPAALGKPVLFGPAIHKALEALRLVEKGGGIIVKNDLELVSRISELLDDPTQLKRTGEAARSLILENRGATDKILEYLEAYL